MGGGEWRGELTEVILVNVLDPVGQEGIGDDEEVEFGDEFAFSW